jgi:hypothetical protein
MAQLTLDVPDDIIPELEELAAERHTDIAGLAVTQLAALVGRPRAERDPRYERFLKESGLFVRPAHRQGQRVPAERLDAIAAKLGAVGPLSDVIIDERGER